MLEWLRVYPCYSATTHALLELKQQVTSSTNVMHSNIALQSSLLDISTESLLSAPKALLAQGWLLWKSLCTTEEIEHTTIKNGTAILLSSMRWTGIEQIEQLPGVALQGIFTGRGRYKASASRIQKSNNTMSRISASPSAATTEDNEERRSNGDDQEEEPEEEDSQRLVKKIRHHYADPVNKVKASTTTSTPVWRRLLCDGFYQILDIEGLGAVSLTIPWSWQQMANTLVNSSSDDLLSPAPVIMITGAKNTGKSTLSRFLVNSLLNSYPEVAYIDADLGQSEFMPPGFISLHRLVEPVLGPSYTHLRIPYRAAFIGRVSPKDDPDDYIEAIHCMIQVYRKEIAQHAIGADGWAREHGVPLVINTQGWVKSLGLDLLIQQFNMIQPTHVGHLSLDMRFPVPLPPDTSTQVIHLDSVDTALANVDPHYNTRRIRRYHAADLRTTQTVSHLYAISLANQHFYAALWHRKPLWAFDRSLTVRSPWCVPWSSVEIRLLAADNPVPMDEVLWALNGTLVALMIPVENTDTTSHEHISDNNDTNEDNSSNDTTQATESSYPLHYQLAQGMVSPYQYTCLGLGLVRAIDPDQRRFYVLAPYSQAQLVKVKLMVRGSLELPICCTIDGGIRRTAFSDVVDRNGTIVPYVKFGAPEGAGAVAWRVRRNIQRKRHDTSSRSK
ncbi:hypothetical protein BDF22DRAFT_662750 [Syncephalis plumigaleata]|nr:hypothetical protein BDF22DRAFT_662750 [Syncephalis plumigaleata]